MPRVRGGNPEVEQAQGYTDEKVGRAVSSWMADGHELSVVLPAGTTKVPHKLGRPLSGWMIQRYKYPGAPAPVLSEVSSDKTTISLIHTGPNPLTVQLWVW